MRSKGIDWLCKKTKLDKKTVLILLMGIAGIILLIVSGFIPDKKEDDEAVKAQENTVTCEDYAEEIGVELESLISSIKGAGETKVMVTLECTDENEYLMQEKKDEVKYENEVVVIETGDGESTVLLKVTRPRIRGVAVVCRGGDSPGVRQSIIDTVTAVLDISAARVSIATMKTDNGG